jgi:hypothetical protein
MWSSSRRVSTWRTSISWAENVVLRSINPNDPAVVAATIIDGNNADVGGEIPRNGRRLVRSVRVHHPQWHGLATPEAESQGNHCPRDDPIQPGIIQNQATGGRRAAWQCDGLITANAITQNLAVPRRGRLA